VDVFDLALDRLRQCVPTLAPATPVVGEHAEVRRKVCRQGGPVCTRGQLRGVEKGDSMKHMAFIASLFGVAV